MFATWSPAAFVALLEGAAPMAKPTISKQMFFQRCEDALATSSEGAAACEAMAAEDV